MMISYTYKKGQTALEFLLIVSFVLIAFVGFMSIIFSQFTDAEVQNVWDTAAYISDAYVVLEVDRAMQSPPGYVRTFTIPERHQNTPFSASIIDEREVVIFYEDFEHVSFLPINVTGNLLVGQNNISKRANGSVLLNLP